MGKALKTAKATVSKGTKEMVVVKVRLPAVEPKRSSRKRSRKVSAVLRHGNRATCPTKACNWRRQRNKRPSHPKRFVYLLMALSCHCIHTSPSHP